MLVMMMVVMTMALTLWPSASAALEMSRGKGPGIPAKVKGQLIWIWLVIVLLFLNFFDNFAFNAFFVTWPFSNSCKAVLKFGLLCLKMTSFHDVILQISIALPILVIIIIDQSTINHHQSSNKTWVVSASGPWRVVLHSRRRRRGSVVWNCHDFH